MIDKTQVEAINKVVKSFFANNQEVDIIPAKKLMPQFIEAGIFVKDIRNGLPLREVFKQLDREDQLDLIPHLHVDRSDKHPFWYFVADPANKPTTPYKKDEKKAETIAKIKARANSDETYIIDLCDEALELVAMRNKRFDFLLGELHKDGVTRTKLPVDAFYTRLNLVVEYRVMNAIADAEGQGPAAIARAKQREMYDRRRAEELPKHNIDLIIISNMAFECAEDRKIIRNKEKDLAKIKEALVDFLPQDMED